MPPLLLLLQYVGLPLAGWRLAREIIIINLFAASQLAQASATLPGLVGAIRCAVAVVRAAAIYAAASHPAQGLFKFVADADASILSRQLAAPLAWPAPICARSAASARRGFAARRAWRPPGGAYMRGAPAESCDRRAGNRQTRSVDLIGAAWEVAAPLRPSLVGAALRWTRRRRPRLQAEPGVICRRWAHCCCCCCCCWRLPVGF